MKKEVKIVNESTIFLPKSGKIYKISQRAKEVIEFYVKGFDFESIKEKLKKYNSKDIEGIYKFIIKLTKEKEKIRHYSNKLFANFNSISMLVSERCNLNCRYCYGEGGSYGVNRNMDFSTAVKIIQWANNILENNNIKLDKFGVNFFGGEPLLNFKVIEQTVKYLKSRNFSNLGKPIFSITTNGVLLNHKIMQFFSKEKFSIVVSIDGPPEIHDRNRPFKNGKGSHSVIVKNLKMMLDHDISEYTTLRATVYPGRGEVKKVVQYLRNLGYKKVQVEYVASNFPERKSEEWCNYAVTKDYGPIFDEFEKRLKEKRSFIDIVPNNIISYIKSLYYRELKRHFCGISQGFFAIDVNGDIYPCQRFVGVPEWYIGNIQTELNREILEKFASLSFYKLKNCRNCWLRFFCGGGCSYNNWLINGSIYEPDPLHCAYAKYIFLRIIPLMAEYKEYLTEVLHLNKMVKVEGEKE